MPGGACPRILRPRNTQHQQGCDANQTTNELAVHMASSLLLVQLDDLMPAASDADRCVVLPELESAESASCGTAEGGPYHRPTRLLGERHHRGANDPIPR